MEFSGLGMLPLVHVYTMNSACIWCTCMAVHSTLRIIISTPHNQNLPALFLSNSVSGTRFSTFISSITCCL